MYELFRNLAVDIKQQYGKVLLFERTFRPTEVVIFTPDKKIDVNMLMRAMSGIINSLPTQAVLPKATVKKVISLEEMVDRLAERIKIALKVSFSEFSSYKKGRSIPKDERVHVIVSFLAMLEMVKQGMLFVTQHEYHGDIEMESQQLETPAYL
jgi:chromatin segregation and condensation protein Rec8/ScpA/Scc1 (kleisin family)